jgi:hypothetical protein
MKSDNNGPHHLQHERLEQHPESLAFADEYVAAQRAAFESILIGRETAAVVQQQGEQLHRADSVADQTQYQLDRATRLLKGMTWSGWVNNMFTALPPLPTPTTKITNPATAGPALSTTTTLPSIENKYDSFPSTCDVLTQAIQNYHANVTILQFCETVEQKQTCLQICNEMYSDASTKIQKQSSSTEIEAYIIEMKSDLEKIRKHQIILQSQVILNPASPKNQTQIEENERNELFGPSHKHSGTNETSPSHSTTSNSSKISSPKKSLLEQKQDEHLHILASSLNELGTIAQSLNAGLHEQNHIIESLDTKSDQLHETSKMVTRRTNRIIQNKSSWMMPSTASQSLKKSTLFGTVTIRHIASGKYLSVMGTDLYLVNQYNSISCTYDIYQRSGSGNSNTIGIKSHANHKWIGQSFLTGSITCSASTFGKREEFETDNSSTWMNSETSKGVTAIVTSNNNTTVDALPNYTTRLLCVSAGWGQGGYIQINSDENYAIRITGITLEDSKNAAQWSITRIG